MIKKREYWYGVLLELGFLLSVLALAVLANVFFMKFIREIVLWMMFVYLFIIVLVYSAFKYYMWGVVFKKKGKFAVFYLLNSGFILGFLVLLTVAYFILKQIIIAGYISIYFIIMLLLMLVLGYIWFNVLQAAVLLNKKIKKCHSAVKRNITKILKTAGIEIAVIAVLFIPYIFYELWFIAFLLILVLINTRNRYGFYDIVKKS